MVHAVPAGSSVHYAYDAAGLLKSVQDENHAAPNTVHTYDELNRLASVQQILGSGAITTRYAYDVEDNLAALTDPNGNTTTYAFDDFHRMQTQKSPVIGAMSYSYDAAGNLTSTTDANNATTTGTYDAANRMLTAASTNGATATIPSTHDAPTPSNYNKRRGHTVTHPP